MENLLSDGRKAILELERGREFATQLRRLILNSNSNSNGEGDDHLHPTTPFAHDLADKVVTSFSNTLLVLNLHTKQHSSCLLPAKSDDSEDSCRSTSAFKERRGSLKRRRTSQTSETESETQIDDGYSWRKYGQKNIMNAKYPRNYYRCSHKFDQGCQATKQVQKMQRIQEKPELYRTTYYGRHTCSRNLVNNDIILDVNSSSHSSVLISFDNNLPTKQAFFSSSSSSSLTMTKQCKEEIPSSSSEDYLLSPELIPPLSSTSKSSHGDPISDLLYDDLVFEPFDF